MDSDKLKKRSVAGRVPETWPREIRNPIPVIINISGGSYEPKHSVDKSIAKRAKLNKKKS